jgi:hypothetical protein
MQRSSGTEDITAHRHSLRLPGVHITPVTRAEASPPSAAPAETPGLRLPPLAAGTSSDARAPGGASK